MTAQMPEHFINEHPQIDLSPLDLYLVSALDPTTDLTQLVGQELKCEIFKRDDERGTFIVKQVEQFLS